MYAATPVWIAGNPYFKYHEYDKNTRNVDKYHGYYVCCAENNEYRCKCKFRTDYPRFEHPHQWVPIADFPYSRLPQKIIEINDNSLHINDNTDIMVKKIIDCFHKMGVANMDVECAEFRDMALQFCKMGHTSGDEATNKNKEMVFSQILKSLTREKFSTIKKEIAEKKRLNMCSMLANKVWNVIADVGTFAGKSRLICKIGRPYEKKMIKLKQMEKKEILPTTFSRSLSSTSSSILSPRRYFTDKSNSKIVNNYEIKYFENDLQFATPVILLIKENGNEIIKKTENTQRINLVTSSPFLQFNEDDDFSPFFLRSYLNVRSANQYVDAFMDIIHIVKYFNGEVVSFTVDFLPVQQMVLAPGGPLHQALIKERGKIIDKGEDVILSDGIKKQQEELVKFVENELKRNTDVECEQKDPMENKTESCCQLKTVNVSTLPPEMMCTPPLLSGPNSPYELNTPNTVERIPSIEISGNIVLPICYGCNCHATHLSFIHAIKKDPISHNLLANYREIVNCLSYYQIRNLIGGRIPAYFATRWLAIYNGITFLEKKEKAIRNLYPDEQLPLLHDLFNFRKILLPLIQHLKYNERDSTNPINSFPISSQLILILRLCQNIFQHNCPVLVNFICELSLEIFLNFIINDKGAQNIVAFALSPQGRDGFRKGYMQWGPNSDSPYFKFYDFLFDNGENEYYSFGDQKVTPDCFRWIEDITKLKSSGDKSLRPYLQYIVDFFGEGSSRSKISNDCHKQESPTKPINMSDKSKPFETILFSTQSIVNSSSNTFNEHKKKLLSLLTRPISELSWGKIFPSEVDKKMEKIQMESEGEGEKIEGFVNLF